ncbi:MAG: polysaccharide deacetylase family protein [Actinomycetota bacterium]|nr:polysaccharide deacetylase family protein [Actinomycetota bacterium]
MDYISGDMDIEAGKSPVVITFDDAGQGQLDFMKTDQGFVLDPNCAVAILEDFLKDYPDFGRGATFNIYYPDPFGQEQFIKEKFEFLVEKGYEIGNHTYSHANLSLLSDEDALMEIALNAKKTNEILPGYTVRSLALPYGLYPQNRDILAEGNYNGYTYINQAVSLVGSNPAPYDLQH